MAVREVEHGDSSRMRPARGTVVLRTVALTKRFGAVVTGEGPNRRFNILTAVDNLNIDVKAGEVLGFLGPNGAGKSTTVGMVLGLVEPSAGKVELFGQDLATHRDVLPGNIGAIIESPAFYPYLSARDNLRALALAVGGVPDGRINSLLAEVGLSDRADSPYKTYSLGMKQRLGIASTLLTDPALVILDEPTNGLDPAGQREVRELIPQLAREGRAVLLASHLLNEVEHICDRVAIIRKGKLLEFGSVKELLRRRSYLEVDIEQPEQAAAILRSLPQIERVTVEHGHLSIVTPEESGAAINRALAEQGLFASAIVPRQSSLEDVFLEVTESESGDASQEGRR